MNALKRFEDWLARLLEGGLASLLGAQIQPVDIAKRLAEYMEDHRTIGAGRRYVPNNFRVYLSPGTLAGFASFQSALQDELGGFLNARARELGYHFVGRVRVNLLADETLRRERVRIEADLVDREGLVLPGPSQTTEAISVAPTVTPHDQAAALVVNGRRVPLETASRVGLGRALDNDLILDDSSISRHHARLVARGRSWFLEDLNSTNGSFVNGRRVEFKFLRPGDEIRLGKVTLQFEETEVPRTE